MPSSLTFRASRSNCSARLSSDVIKFLREHDGLTFIEAIEKLAYMVNIEIPKGNNNKNDDSKVLLDTNKLVNEQYIKNLENDTVCMD